MALVLVVANLRKETYTWVRGSKRREQDIWGEGSMEAQSFPGLNINFSKFRVG